MQMPLIALTFVALGVVAEHSHTQERSTYSTPAQADCIPPEQTAAILADIARFSAALPPQPPAITSGPDPYRFVPIAGSEWDDVHVFNFVDLDPSGGVLDADCLDWTYDTHRGHDLHLRTFAEMDAGVPVFAALAGIVVSVHDGEPDRNIVPSSAPSNLVILWHGGTHYSWYLHFRRNSIAVTAGQRVAAGQQIGLVGSSGNSAWPHLHFESWDDNLHYEPDSGPCRSGSSHWTNQVSRTRGTRLLAFDIGPGDFHLQPRLPEDYVRQGTWGTGWQYIGFWLQYLDVPANATARVRWLKPDTSVAIDSGTGAFGNSIDERWNWVWYRWWVDCDQVGTWRIEFSLNGQVVADMPFEVVNDPQSAPNHLPEPLQSIAFEPAVPTPGDVLFCRVTQGLLRDRDYEFVSYRYRWLVNGISVRDVTHAGRADCLPDDALSPGAVVSCSVTPTDGTNSGAASTLSVTAGNGPCLELRFRDSGQLGGGAKPLVLGPGPRDYGFTPDSGALALIAISLGPCGVGLPIPQSPPCLLPPALLLPDLSQGPLLTVGGAQMSVPPSIPWCYCTQGIEILPIAGGLCLKFTNGYHLFVRC